MSNWPIWLRLTCPRPQLAHRNVLHSQCLQGLSEQLYQRKTYTQKVMLHKDFTFRIILSVICSQIQLVSNTCLLQPKLSLWKTLISQAGYKPELGNSTSLPARSIYSSPILDWKLMAALRKWKADAYCCIVRWTKPKLYRIFQSKGAR